MTDRAEPTAEQVKAVASPLRLRILRLCHEGEWTNQDLARRLHRDPSTILHHLRILEAAGLVESVGVRPGKRGGYEKPYRSTGLTWGLAFDNPTGGEPPLLTAFRQELAEAGTESIAQLTRFYLHLDDSSLEAFIEEFLALVEKYREDDEARKGDEAPAYGAILAVHRLKGTA